MTRPAPSALTFYQAFRAQREPGEQVDTVASCARRTYVRLALFYTVTCALSKASRPAADAPRYCEGAYGTGGGE